MPQIENKLVQYIEQPLIKIIEAVVTNNLGFNPNRYKPWKEKIGKFNYVDCRGLSYEDAKEINPNNTELPRLETDDSNIMSLHWHLNRLDGEKILNWYGMRDKKVPKYMRFEFDRITL